MFGGRPPGYGRSVQVQLRVDGRESLAGEVVPERGAALPFVGWLGLLRALSDVLGTEDGEAGESPPAT